MKPRLEQDLIGIDITDSGQKILVEKQALQAAWAAADKAFEFAQADFQRLGAKIAEWIVRPAPFSPDQA